MNGLRNLLVAIIVIGLSVATSSAADAKTKTRRDCYNICTEYDKNGKCKKTERYCYEVIVEEPDIIQRDLTPPTQNCASADGTVYKCN